MRICISPENKCWAVCLAHHIRWTFILCARARCVMAVCLSHWNPYVIQLNFISTFRCMVKSGLFITHISLLSTATRQENLSMLMFQFSVNSSTPPSSSSARPLPAKPKPFAHFYCTCIYAAITIFEQAFVDLIVRLNDPPNKMHPLYMCVCARALCRHANDLHAKNNKGKCPHFPTI